MKVCDGGGGMNGGMRRERGNDLWKTKLDDGLPGKGDMNGREERDKYGL